MKLKKVTSMLAVFCMASSLALTGCGEKESTKEETATVSTTENTDQYLKEYFGVEVNDDLETKDGFMEALGKTADVEGIELEEYTPINVLKAAVDAADYKELVLTYPEEKVKERMESYGLEFKGENEDAAYIACAMDTGFLSDDLVTKATGKDAYTKEEAAEILMSVANANGDGRNYLGMASDEDIYGKIDNAWNSFLLFDDSTLNEIGLNSVLNEVTTGFNLKSNAYDARFLKELTLQYSHSDILHAHQLIGLLNSEDIDAKIQLEPKVSIYEYLLDWGPFPETTATYEVRQHGDRYFVHAVEYDMQLEFNNEEDMNRFDKVINDYAKKNAGNEEAEGLIAESWWQPLYTSLKDGMSEKAYHEIRDCAIDNGMYTLHSFCLVEDEAEVVDSFTQMSGELEVNPVTRYCDTAFYHYMTGEDYQ